jgi:Protein phosphatase 2C
MSQISLATASTPGRANEDYVAAGADWALILDGATAPAGIDNGCIHDVRWLVHRVATAIMTRLNTPRDESLANLLAEAIRESCQAHDKSCDLSNPDSPSTTVSIVRANDAVLDYLTLGDSPIVLWQRNQTFTCVADDRAANLPGGRPYSIELVRAHRNKASGFWVASTQPEAAFHAIAGVAPVADICGVGLFTDGVTRLLDWYGYTWPAIFSTLRSQGPSSLIGLVRAAETEQPHPYDKQHDDASAIYVDLCP